MDVALLRSYADKGMTRQQIAEAIGMSYSRTTTILRENGIIVKRKRCENARPIKGNVKQALELRKKGFSYKQIAKMLGAPWERIAHACQKHGLGGAIIEQRLTESQVADYVSKSGFDYVGGYQSMKKPITVKCRDCGRTFERQAHVFRDVANGTWQCGNECPLCRADRQQALREQREAIRKAEQEREAQEKAQQRAQRKAEQLSRKVSDQLIKRLATRVCKNCGKEFCLELSDYHSEIYCSEQCQKRCHDRIKRDKRIRRIKTREMDPDITLEKLYARDNGVCYLCGITCDWTDGQTIDGQFVAGETYPSIDHVKPISKGGTHTWDNIKLACRHCNTVKGWR